MQSLAREGARVGGARNWSNLVLDFTGAAPAILGPFETPIDALLVQQGAGASLFLVDEPVSTDAITTFGTEFLYELGLPLGTNGAFYPAHVDRFWLVTGGPIASLTVLTLFWDLRVPATR